MPRDKFLPLIEKAYSKTAPRWREKFQFWSVYKRKISRLATVNPRVQHICLFILFQGYDLILHLQISLSSGSAIKLLLPTWIWSDSGVSVSPTFSLFGVSKFAPLLASLDRDTFPWRFFFCETRKPLNLSYLSLVIVDLMAVFRTGGSF